MAGPLSDNGDINDYMMLKQMAGNNPPQAAPMADTPPALPRANGDNISGNDRGALSAATTNGMPPSATSPQEWRDLQLLETARGLASTPHTGHAAEGVQNMYANLAGVAEKQLTANAVMRAKMAEIGAAKDAEIEKGRQANQAKVDVANIMAGKNSQTNLDPDEIEEMGLPPGTVATRNKFGQIHVIHSPPASQQQMTGYDDQGKPTYAQPGAVLTPKVRSDMQTYLKNSESALPKLDEQIARMEGPDNSQTSLGVTGKLEDWANATAGQAAGLMGRKKPFFEHDTIARNNLKQLNELLMPALTTDPRSSHMSRVEISGMLPSLGMGEDAGDALTKLKTIRATMKQRRDEYADQLKGQSSITDTGDKEDKPAPDEYTPEQIEREKRRRGLIK